MQADISGPTVYSRFQSLDMLRGIAVLWMAAFHLAFDLNYFGLIRQDFYRDPFWTHQRTCIVSLFLIYSGIGLALAHVQSQSASRFWRRWVQVAICAVLVSAGSLLIFPKSFISFGVLHAIAVMWILTRVMLLVSDRWAHQRIKGLVIFGAAIVLLPLIWQHAFFDSRWTYWLGLVTRKPYTEDFVPLLPWWGVMLWGVAAGFWLIQRRPSWLDRSRWTVKPLARLGQWSLSFYMLHQPVFFGLLAAALWLDQKIK
jgi:uncharacterized membrane protein